MNLHLDLLKKVILDIHSLNKTSNIVLRDDFYSKEELIYDAGETDKVITYVYCKKREKGSIFSVSVFDNYLNNEEPVYFHFYSSGAVELVCSMQSENGINELRLMMFRRYFGDFIMRQNHFINPIFSFNYQADILNQGSSRERTTEFIVSELMEMNGIPKTMKEDVLKPFKTDINRPILNKIDDNIDIIIYAMGELFKDLIAIGVSEDMVKSCSNALINHIAHTNLTKLEDKNINSKGKVTKPDGFVEPEEITNHIIECYK